jgi:hypothetical protein
MQFIFHGVWERGKKNIVFAVLQPFSVLAFLQPFSMFDGAKAVKDGSIAKVRAHLLSRLYDNKYAHLSRFV